ncbi:MAG: phosphotransferase [Bacteroidota bacterium]
MEFDPNQIIPIAEKNVGGFSASGDPVPLSGGNLNHIWRVPGTSHNVIVKYAPPYIAGQPDIPLDPMRIHFEAKALQQFTDCSALHQLKSNQISPPELYHFDVENHLLIMEDVGKEGGLFSGDLDEMHMKLSATLGGFIGNLHRETAGNSWFRENFNNTGIQQTRKQVQYDGVENFLVSAGITPDQNAVDHARNLGERLLTPGKCMVMGDLWPPSLVIQQDRLRIIDWEFAHYGYPLQDVAHFAAHCFMYHKRFSGELGRNFKTVWQNFLSGYREGCGKRFDALLSRKEVESMNIHFGAEILIRTIGTFQEGYIFANHQGNGAEELIAIAVNRMRNPGWFAENPGDDLLF